MRPGGGGTQSRGARAHDGLRLGALRGLRHEPGLLLPCCSRPQSPHKAAWVPPCVTISELSAGARPGSRRTRAAQRAAGLTRADVLS
jgi:hypothetical protein